MKRLVPRYAYINAPAPFSQPPTDENILLLEDDAEAVTLIHVDGGRFMVAWLEPLRAEIDL